MQHVTEYQAGQLSLQLTTDKRMLKLLTALKRPQELKINLPTGAQYLDRGGLTFVHSNLLPWLHAVEKQVLNDRGYRRYIGCNSFDTI